MHKHVFEAVGQPLPELEPEWTEYRCIYCKRKTGLVAWQIKELSVEMATCKKSPVRMGFLERIRNSIDCLGRWDWMVFCKECRVYMGKVSVPVKPGKNPRHIVMWKTCRRCESDL